MATTSRCLVGLLVMQVIIWGQIPPTLPPSPPPGTTIPPPRLPDPTKPNEIIGRATGPDGKPLPGAIINTVRRWPVDAKSPMYARVTTDKNGDYRVPDLVSGYYLVCLDAPGLPLLDACHWTQQPASRLLRGNEVARVDLRAIQGAFLHIRIDDPQLAIANKERALLSTPVSAEVVSTTGIPLRALVMAKDPKGLNLRLVVPKDRDVALSLRGIDIDFEDDQGRRLLPDRAAAVLRVQPNETEKVLRFTGRARVQ